MRQRRNAETGASALLIAVAMFLLLGMAAIAIDVGAAFNERRQDQTAADVAVMAGALQTVNGTVAVRSQILDLVERNLTTTFDPSDYQAAWESCVDPVAERNTEPFDDFVALPPPTGWTLADAANWCISVDGSKGLLRVRVPDQLTPAFFGRVLGTEALVTNASAVADIDFGAGAGGVLPFSLPGAAGGGELTCLSSGPTGNAQDPCEGSSQGNFGPVDLRQFGNDDLGTPENCPNTANPGRTFAQNIATGADHILATDSDADSSNEVRDYTCDTPFPDTLQSNPGFPNNSLEQGLVGPVPGGFTPRLQQVDPLTDVVSFEVNDTPLWTYLLPITDGSDENPDYGGAVTVGFPGASADDAPASCDPNSFEPGPMDWDEDGFPDDLNGDLVADEGDSWLHVAICFRQYIGDFNFDGDTDDVGIDTTPYSSVMIDSAILGNVARFAYVPQFHENSWGGTDWIHIQRFRAVYLQSTAWKSNRTNFSIHHPGEACSCSGLNGYALWGLSAFTFPDAALPVKLRGNPVPGSTGLNPFSASLRR